MTIQCGEPVVAHLGRADRDYISWPVSGQTASATVEVELEQSGEWWLLDIGDGWATGYFAGPDYPEPGTAHVVPSTSHCRIRVVDSDISVIFDGGFVRILP